MTETERTVLDVIRLLPGRKYGVRGRDLAEAVELRHRLLREVIESLITVHGIPIGSDPINGYYLILTEDEFRKARHELVTRIEALGRRLRALEAAFTRQSTELLQPLLPFEPDERNFACE